MTIEEAIQRGIKEVRLPFWAPDHWLELPEKLNNHHGPWCHLHAQGEKIDLLISDADDNSNEWEEYEPSE